MSDPTAALLVIGDEILSGKVEDTNSKVLIRELRRMGVSLRRIWTLPDHVEEIAHAVRDTASRFDHVFTSGGIGPTHDDVTMAGIARALGKRVVRHPDVARSIEAYFGNRTNEMLFRMAEIPEGAELLLLVDGLLPLFRVENVYILPGIPELFERCFAAIAERFRGRPFHVSRVYTILDEAAIAELLDRTQRRFAEVAIGSYPQLAHPRYRVLVTLESRDPEALRVAADEILSGLPPESIVPVVEG
ncbi:MAG: competence/damage-inducible protein A [Planctomycetes bacterium]|nr:competence/damage-inducible protein A [Planctomycetota bacterium]